MLQDHFDAVFIDLVGGLEAASLAIRACLGLLGTSLFPVAGRHGDVCVSGECGVRVETCRVRL